MPSGMRTSSEIRALGFTLTRMSTAATYGCGLTSALSEPREAIPAPRSLRCCH